MIISLGDLLLDVIVRLRQPLADGADAVATTQLGPGGQAANVAAWVAELGGPGALRRQTRPRRGGRDAARGLQGHGVEVCGPVVEGRTGIVVSLVAEDGSRTMASDRGVSPELRVDELDPAWLDAPTSTFPATRSSGADPTSRAPRRRARAARQRRPLVLERNPRLRAGAVPRAAAGAPTDDRLRERGRGADHRRPVGAAASGC